MTSIFEVYDILFVLLPFINKNELRNFYGGVSRIARNFIEGDEECANSLRPIFRTPDNKNFRFNDVFYRYLGCSEQVSLEYARYPRSERPRIASFNAYMKVDLELSNETGEIVVTYHLGHFVLRRKNMYFVHQKRSNDGYFKFYLMDEDTFERFYSLHNNYNELVNLCKYSGWTLSALEECSVR